MQKCPNEFRVGDIVIGLCSYGGKDLKGITGTIKKIADVNYGVVWDKNVGGHMLGGDCEDGYGWWVPEDIIEPYNLVLENK